MATKKERGRTFDGVTRPSNDTYRKNFDRIFGKKIKKDEEVVGYYINGYENKGIEVLTEKKKK
jgi:hypothetical protein